MNNVFVYGTLKSGHGNNYLLEDCIRLGLFMTLQPFRMHNVGFPVTFYEPKGASVLGELYEIPDGILDRTIKRLDRLEGEGHMYKREHVYVTAVASVEPARPAYMYVGVPQYWGDNWGTRDNLMLPRAHGMLEWGGETEL